MGYTIQTSVFITCVNKKTEKIMNADVEKEVAIKLMIARHCNYCIGHCKVASVPGLE